VACQRNFSSGFFQDFSGNNMNKIFSIHGGIIFSVVLALGGCGGGGGGDTKPSPTPPSSAAVSSLNTTSVSSSSLALSTPSSSAAQSSASAVPSSKAATSAATSASASSVLVIVASSAGSSLTSSSSSSKSSSSLSSRSSLSSSSKSSSISSSSLSSSSSSVASSSVASSASGNSLLTVKGSVAADALVGGSVLAAIGSKQFTAQVGSDKSYTLVLDVATADLQTPISLTATGAGSNKWVVLAALLPSAKVLAELAGTDKLLTAAEFFGTNITLLSTAEYAEIKNMRLPVATDDARKFALLNLHSTKSIEQAGVLSRLLNDVNADLPIQTATTLDYLLDTDLADAYLEILQISKKRLVAARVEGLGEDPEQTKVTTKAIIGTYFVESKNSRYLLTLNADGTGSLKTQTIHSQLWALAKVATSISWRRTNNSLQITLADPLSHKLKSISDLVAFDEVRHVCDDSTTTGVEECSIQLNSIELDLVDESDSRYFALLRINLTATNDKGRIIYSDELLPQTARLVSLAGNVPVAVADVSGFEWFNDYYSYAFSADGKVKITNLQSRVVTNTNWILDGNRIVTNGTDLWLTHRDASGYSAVFNDSGTVYRTSLVKRVPVSMQESDWVGRWTSVRNDVPVSAYDVRSDKTWRDGFENGSKGSWVRTNAYTQTAVSNGVWRMARDLLAIHNGVYYFSVCQGIEVSTFVSCYLSQDTRAVNFDSRVFWNTWSYPVFNEQGGGVFNYLNNTVITSATLGGQFSGRLYPKVSATRLFNKATNTILEMTGASANGIELCEYALNDACRDKDKRTYERGLEIGLTATSGGYVNYAVDYRDLDANTSTGISRSVEKVFMVPKNTPQKLTLYPSAGYQIESVKGCDGSISGSIYSIPARTENCEITVSFVKK
jgi:hypothetical protein